MHSKVQELGICLSQGNILKHLLQNTKLPTQWLANGSGHHDNTVSALWALRDLMTKDALMVSRTLEFSQL